MYIQRTSKKQNNGKISRSAVLMHNRREGKKIIHEKILTITNWGWDLIDKFDLLLKGKLTTNIDDLLLSNGKSLGAISVISQIADRIGISKALGSSVQAKRALFQTAARIISPGSRNYYANEWSKTQEYQEIFKMDSVSEDMLYSNLGWLSNNQDKIEQKIFFHRYKNKEIKEIFLYDVTSSYFEGIQNELSEFGYNRDKKNGKMQIVIGLMLDSEGFPISVEVFSGNTSDVNTVSSQLSKLKSLFGVERVIFVGDKGMIKSSQIEEIESKEYKWNYLTSITKRQIQTLINNGTLQLSMFDENIIEVEDGERYILRKNNLVADKKKYTRHLNIINIEELVESKNKYLAEHPKAKLEVAIKKIEEKIGNYKLANILSITGSDRQITLLEDKSALLKAGELDGCYVLKSNIPKTAMDAKTLHSRYKDLSLVENSFRTMKTGMEEIRPIFVRKEENTRGHVFVAMLALMIIKYIRENTRHLGYTLRYIIETLDKIQFLTMKYEEKRINIKPKHLTEDQSAILEALKIKL